MYASFSILFLLAALLSFVNYRWIRLPATIGQLVLALGLALLVIALQYVFPGLYQFFCDIVLNTNFTHILLDILLGFLLFAGALHVDINGLKRERLPVFLFATFGVLISTFLVGWGLYLLTHFLGIPIALLDCMLFGALISPTDPIAVLALLKSANISPSLQLKIEGESLFNDGIGVIVFTGILLVDEMAGVATGKSLISDISMLITQEVFLGLALGGIIGWLGFLLMKNCRREENLSTIISLAVVFGGYSFASFLHTSGPLAMVVAGLYIGHKIKAGSYPEETRRQLSGFWEVLDESLNGILFVLLGLAIHLIHISAGIEVLLLFCTILLILIARFISVALPYSLLRHQEHTWLNTSLILTWGGLRGGISLALAYSISDNMSGNSILFLTYGIVIFSILIQGLSIPNLVKKLSM